eukprot:CAMPEP_0194315036 /NCGR_PEP_ID=MMETSP0171-20130528/11836_1 /TAXON_ID=218684 /ORGANISM="Corethron pennatum, Strain L29A3" /LENGTH=273 /DNA_ID=CAMNT_0039070677 /DNA_START=75 /DNA_END=893 /DNA_ORIENTATION=-
MYQQHEMSSARSSRQARRRTVFYWGMLLASRAVLTRAAGGNRLRSGGAGQGVGAGPEYGDRSLQMMLVDDDNNNNDHDKTTPTSTSGDHDFWLLGLGLVCCSFFLCGRRRKKTPPSSRPGVPASSRSAEYGYGATDRATADPPVRRISVEPVPHADRVLRDKLERLERERHGHTSGTQARDGGTAVHDAGTHVATVYTKRHFKKGVGVSGTEVTIPSSFTTIGKYAFECEVDITSVTIPESVTTIRKYAFWNCTALATVRLPPSLATLGSSAF